MVRSELVRFLRAGLSIRKIALRKGKSYTTARYWLKKHGLAHAVRPRYQCPCGETDPLKFTARLRGVCAKCHNKTTLDRQRKNKLWAVAIKGGKCLVCGYARCVGSLDFHHLDPSTKHDDGHMAIKRGWGRERLKKELDKCVLVCRNCHGEIHAGLIDVSNFGPVAQKERAVVS